MRDHMIARLLLLFQGSELAKSRKKSIHYVDRASIFTLSKHNKRVNSHHFLSKVVCAHVAAQVKWLAGSVKLELKYQS